jgi:hypothetical protein
VIQKIEELLTASHSVKATRTGSFPLSVT